MSETTEAITVTETVETKVSDDGNSTTTTTEHVVEGPSPELLERLEHAEGTLLALSVSIEGALTRLVTIEETLALFAAELEEEPTPEPVPETVVIAEPTPPIETPAEIKTEEPPAPERKRKRFVRL